MRDKFTARWWLKCHEGAGSIRFKVLSYSRRENVSSAYSPLRIVLAPPGANQSDSAAAWNSSGYARSAACAERTAVIVCVLRNCTLLCCATETVEARGSKGGSETMTKREKERGAERKAFTREIISFVLPAVEMSPAKQVSWIQCQSCLAHVSLVRRKIELCHSTTKPRTTEDLQLSDGISFRSHRRDVPCKNVSARSVTSLFATTRFDGATTRFDQVYCRQVLATINWHDRPKRALLKTILEYGASNHESQEWVVKRVKRSYEICTLRIMCTMLGRTHIHVYYIW